MNGNPLLRIVYLQNILDYTYDNAHELLKVIIVNSAWDECVMEYCHNIWSRICKMPSLCNDPWLHAYDPWNKKCKNRGSSNHHVLHRCVYYYGPPKMINLLLLFSKID